MLAFFRNLLSSKIAAGIFALIMLAFVLGGVVNHEMPGMSSLTGDDGAVAARIGGRALTVPDLEQSVRNQVASIAQQQPGLSVPQFVAQGGYDQVVDQATGALAMEMFGRGIGITASKKQIDGEIAGVPAFAGATGKFDRAAYLAVLAQQHIVESKLRADIAGDIVRRSIFLPASGAVTLPDGLVRPYAALLTEVRQGSVGFVPAAAMAGGAAPTPAEIQAFYRAHLAQYSLPERRVLRYALIGRDQVAAQAIPSEAEIRKFYDANPQTYGARQTRELEQVVMPTEAAAKALKAAIAGGKSFEDAASAAGFGAKDIAIGTKSQGDYAALSSPAVAAAAFALPDGGVSDPVKSDFGWHVVKVARVNMIAATPYEKARPEIAGDLGKQMQDKALGALVGKTQDAIDAGKSFPDIARAGNLTVIETPPLTQTGANPDQPGAKPAPEVMALLKSGFASAPDQPATIETIQPNERYALLGVGKIVAAAAVPLAQIMPRVTADVTTSRAVDRAKSVAEAIAAKVRAGTPIAAAFAAAPAKLPPVQQGKTRRIDLAQAQGQIPISLQALFTLTAGAVKVVPTDNGVGWYVVRLDAIAPGDPALLPTVTAQSKGELVQSISDEYVQQLARAAGEVVGSTRNNAAIADLKRQLLTGTGPAAQ